jgi:cytochrome c oxidase subunit 2
MPAAAFAKWARGGGQQGAAPTQPKGQEGLTLFNQQGCNGCHTLAAAGSHATTGPDLDKLAAEAERAGVPLEKFTEDSITHPNAYIEPGYPKSVMPDFGAKLTNSQVDFLVQFLVASAKKGSS